MSEPSPILLFQILAAVVGQAATTLGFLMAGRHREGDPEIIIDLGFLEITISARAVLVIFAVVVGALSATCSIPY